MFFSGPEDQIINSVNGKSCNLVLFFCNHLFLLSIQPGAKEPEFQSSVRPKQEPVKRKFKCFTSFKLSATYLIHRIGRGKKQKVLKLASTMVTSMSNMKIYDLIGLITRVFLWESIQLRPLQLCVLLHCNCSQSSVNSESRSGRHWIVLTNLCFSNLHVFNWNQWWDYIRTQNTLVTSMHNLLIRVTAL